MEAIFIYGIKDGLIIALLAVAFSLVYSAFRFLDMSVAGLFVAATYLFIAVNDMANAQGVIGFMALTVAAAIGTFALHLILEQCLFQPFRKKGAGPLVNLIVSLCLYSAIVNAVALIFGTDHTPFPLIVEGDMLFAAINTPISKVWLLQVLFAVCLLTATLLFLRKTSLGNQVLALADNPSYFESLGLSIRRTRVRIMAIAALLIAASSTLSSLEIGIEPYYQGFNALLIAVSAMILGGVQRFGRVTIISLLIGIITNAAQWFFAAKWDMVLVFSTLIITLAVRPSGLIPEKSRAEA